MDSKRFTAAATLLAILAVAATPAIAGGPLVIVPTAQGLEPARWEGTVPVYVDLGGLGVVDPAQATGLLRAALKSWSAVRTSTFRAQIVGTTGAPPVVRTWHTSDGVTGGWPTERTSSQSPAGPRRSASDRGDAAYRVRRLALSEDAPTG